MGVHVFSLHFWHTGDKLEAGRPGNGAKEMCNGNFHTSHSYYPFSSSLMKAREEPGNETSSYIANYTYVVFPLPVGPMMAFSPQGSSPLQKETKSSMYQIMG